MGLSDYRRKRRFAKTPEPQGRNSAPDGHQFVVQQHAATNLHFDFRLELDGTLKSWAVPKGPSLDPAERRLAVHVEDHPVEYAGFEGTIPEGEYGAGTVIVWDHGQWEPIGDARKGYRDGKLKFQLHGKKLTGAWTLVRMRPKEGESADNWLLIKERDAAVVPTHVGDILRDRPESVLSGMTIAEVTAHKSLSLPSRSRRARGAGILQTVRGIAAGRSVSIPATVDLALAQQATRSPEGDEWIHEIKFDGYRILARLDHGKVQLRTRGGHDWTGRFPEIATAIGRLPVNVAILDGEVTALTTDGISHFGTLQGALSRRSTSTLVFNAFDLVYLEGFDLRGVTLQSRKDLLKRLIDQNRDPRLQFVEHVTGSGSEFFSHCKRLGLEGMVSKNRSSLYRGGRSGDWLKVKCVLSEPFVIGGFTTPPGQESVRALLVGLHDDAGRLIYIGRVGSGFTEQSGRDLDRRLRRIERSECPFANPVPKERGREFHWTRPQLVAQIRFAGWTNDGLLRHPVFDALRDDTDPTDLVQEPTRVKPRAKRPASAKAQAARSAEPMQPVSRRALSELAEVRLTSPQKILYPDVGLTKLDLVRYYFSIADWILPHVAGRPLSLVRCPNGQNHSQFFQKHAGPETPNTVRQIPIADEGKIEQHLYVDEMKGLVSLVQIAALEIHVWGCRVDRIEQPDRLVIDLDPDEAVPFAKVMEAAGRVRERLQHAGMTAFVKTTGGKGLHVVAPLVPRHTWEQAKQFSQLLAQGLAADYPQSYTASSSKRGRAGRIYIDYLRNSRGATAIASYSTRARPGAPVAVPLAWDELSVALRPDQFNVLNLPDRLRSLAADPWAEMTTIRQSITQAAMKKVR